MKLLKAIGLAILIFTVTFAFAIAPRFTQGLDSTTRITIAIILFILIFIGLVIIIYKIT